MTSQQEMRVWRRFEEKTAEDIISRIFRQTRFHFGCTPTWAWAKWLKEIGDESKATHWDRKRTRHGHYYDKIYGYEYTEPWLTKY